MSTINETVANYIAAWNEVDPAKRHAIVARTFAEDGSYLDAHQTGTGHDAITSMIGATQARFAGYRFRLSSGIELHNNRLRFSWTAGGTEAAPLFFAGTDFAQTASDGRFQMVTGFTDAAPAAV